MSSGNLYNTTAIPPPSSYPYPPQLYSPSAPSNPQYYGQQPSQPAPGTISLDLIGIWNPQQQQGNLPPPQNPTNQRYPGTFSPHPPQNWQPPKY
jgi:hypothetical protein